MAVELQSTLDGTTNVELKENNMYLVDFSRLQSVNDLVLILAAMSIAFPWNHPHIEKIKAFLNTDNPVEIPQQQKEFIPLKKD